MLVFFWITTPEKLKLTIMPFVDIELTHVEVKDLDLQLQLIFSST